jgi:uncharacterized repeat protein (TIGR03803 family)
MKKLRIACVFAGFLCLVLSLPAQTFTVVHSFDFTDGDLSYPRLIQSTDGNLYGATSSGGANGGGTVFKMTPGGTLTTLYSFCALSNCMDGYYPFAGLVLASNGNFYGTTLYGGTNFINGVNVGTVFEITPSGTYTTLYSFCAQSNCADGYYPDAGLVQGTDGNFYGTTTLGGANLAGTIFKITPSGTLTTLHSFGGGTDGLLSNAGLIQATDGNFYGTTNGGGTNRLGTVYRITPSGTLTTLHSFDGTDGSNSDGVLVQATDGNFYGTTIFGGTNGGGTVFKMTPGGTLTTLYSFCSLTGCADGDQPYAGLIQATDGDLYGTTIYGLNRGGTIFKITTSGTFTSLHTFANTDGTNPYAGLVQDTNGNFYGTTITNGNPSCAGGEGCGTVFSLSEGLSPFVETQPTSGKVGANVTILGTGLTGATSVKFGSTTAPFTVVSDSEITTAVPAGATTALVSVTAPGGTLKSNRKFLVTPQVLSFTPTSGPVGTVVTITGVSLMQTEGVGFGDRVPAQFTVNSDTKLTATVPSGAKTGPVGAKTPGGTGISSKKFTVTQ